MYAATLVAGLSIAGVVNGAPAADLVDLVSEPMPGFPADVATPFDVYSGFLNVSGVDVAGYDGWVIHYQFHTSQSTPATDPIMIWHTGGPGGSSIYGQWCETGYFQVSEQGQAINEFAWNRVANTLFLEAPAGSYLAPTDHHSGFSYCTKGGERQSVCKWDDVTQAEAYAHTLKAFFAAFPEYGSSDLFLAGESYAGQYIPNIATHLLDPEGGAYDDIGARLQGIAVGNGCWGGGEDSVNCNGPNPDRDLMQMYHGKGLLSTKLHDSVLATCQFPDLPFDSPDLAHKSLACRRVLAEADAAVGPHDVYDVYDNCPSGMAFYEKSGLTPRGLREYLHEHRFDAEKMAELSDMGGGYDWTCDTFDALPAYFARADVRAKLNMPAVSETSEFRYTQSGPASVTLYPELLKKLRVLIYEGDADPTVPHVGTEAWTSGLAERGDLVEMGAWHPWYNPANAVAPIGFATTYRAAAAKEATFTYVSVKLAGHEVPHFTPEAGFLMFERFIKNTAW